MKTKNHTKNHITWNILLISLGCFFFISHSSLGIFGEGFDPRRAEEEASLKAQQEATQRQRLRDLTYSDSQNISSETAACTTLSNDSQPTEQTSEQLENEANLIAAVKDNILDQLIPVIENKTQGGILIAFKINSQGRLQGRFVKPEEAARLDLVDGSVIPARMVSSDQRICKLVPGSEEVIIKVASPLRLRAGGGESSKMSDEPQSYQFSDCNGENHDQFNQAHREWEEKQRRDREEKERQAESAKAFAESERIRYAENMNQLTAGCTKAELADPNFMRAREERLKSEYQSGVNDFKAIHERYHGK